MLKSANADTSAINTDYALNIGMYMSIWWILLTTYFVIQNQHNMYHLDAWTL